MPTTTIIFEVQDRDARAGFERLQRELNATERDLRDTQRSATQTGDAVEKLGRISQRTGQQMRETRTGEMEGFKRALQAIEASNADQRLRDVNEIAKLPGIHTPQLETFSLTLAKLRAEAEATRRALTTAVSSESVTPNFQAALAASRAYYQARITQAQEALAKEQAGTEKYQALQTQIFEIGQQQLHAQRQLAAERARLIQQSTRERIAAATDASTVAVESFQKSGDAAKAYATVGRTSAAVMRSAITPVERMRAVHTETFASVTADIQTANAALQAFIATQHLGVQTLQVFDRNRLDAAGRVSPFAETRDVVPRIPRVERTAPIDTTPDIYAERLQQIAAEEKAVQQSLRRQTAAYRRFANLVSNTFVNLATGRAESFQQVATAFIQQSLRIIARAYVESAIQKRLDGQLTASKLANISRVAAAQRTGGLAGGGATGNLGGIGSLLGNIPGLGNIGSLLSGGGAALGASALLFPKESQNLLSGIKDEIGGLISSVASLPDKSFGAKQQVFLQIGENAVREITDIQNDLRSEDRI